MSNRLFNVAIGIPPAILQRVAGLRLSLFWTLHAKRQAVEDKYGILPRESYAQRFAIEDGWTTVEVEIDAKHHVTKFVVRRPVDANRSLVLVIRHNQFDRLVGRVVTCWTNLTTDTHRSLDKTRFAPA